MYDILSKTGHKKHTAVFMLNDRYVDLFLNNENYLFKIIGISQLHFDLFDNKSKFLIFK